MFWLILGLAVLIWFAYGGFHLAVYIAVNAAFVVFTILAYANRWGTDPSEITTNWQPAVGAFLVAGLHAFGWQTNLSEIKKFQYKQAHPEELVA